MMDQVVPINIKVLEESSRTQDATSAPLKLIVSRNDCSTHPNELEVFKKEFGAIEHVYAKSCSRFYINQKDCCNHSL